MQKELLFKTMHNWRTLLLGLVIFIVIYIGINVFYTPFGGCAGCIPDDNGKIICANECSRINPIWLILGSYFISIAIILVFNRKDENNIIAKH